MRFIRAYLDDNRNALTLAVDDETLKAFEDAWRHDLRVDIMMHIVLPYIENTRGSAFAPARVDTRHIMYWRDVDHEWDPGLQADLLNGWPPRDRQT